MRMPVSCRFSLHIHSHTILKIPIELQPYIKALVLILMHINRFHQKPQVRIADVLFLNHLLQEVCCSFQLVSFPFADLIELLAFLNLLLQVGDFFLTLGDHPIVNRSVFTVGDSLDNQVFNLLSECGNPCLILLYLSFIGRLLSLPVMNDFIIFLALFLNLD